MERENVKERFWWGLTLIIVVSASFSNLALWNDGAHFLFRIYDRHLPFVDPHWERWSDIIYQIPTWLLVVIDGPSAFSNWLFKFSLLITPIASLMLWISYLKKNHESKSVVLSSYSLAWLFPLLLLFPISTISITLVAGTMLLSLFFKEKVHKTDIWIFSLCHIVLFFGHEMGFLILGLLLLLGIYLRQNIFLGKISGMKLFWIEFVLIALLIFWKKDIWAGKLILGHEILAQKSLLSSPTAGLLIPIMSIVMMFSSSVVKRALGGISLFYLTSSLYLLWGLSFYHLVLLGRIIAVPLLLVMFILLMRLKKTPRLDHYFWGGSFLVYLLLLGKAFFLWEEFENRLKPFDKKGCQIFTEKDLSPWSTPQWSLPYLHIVKQHKTKLDSLLIDQSVSDEGKCQMMYKTFVVGSGVAYNTERFNKAFELNLPFSQLKGFEVSLPYEKSFPLIVIRNDEGIQIKNSREITCLEIEGEVLTDDAQVQVLVDGQLYLNKVVEGNFRQVIKVPQSLFLYFYIEDRKPHSSVIINKVSSCSEN